MKPAKTCVFAIAAILSVASFASCRPKDGKVPEVASASAVTPDSPAPENSANRAALEALGFTFFATPRTFSEFTVTALYPEKESRASLNSRELAGEVTLLNFWATWCPPCKAELPSIQRLFELMKGSEFRVAAISVGEKRETVEDFIASEGYTFPVYLDEAGSLGQVYASQGIPTTYIVGKDGMVVAGTVGSREYDEPGLVAALRALAAE